MPEEATVSTVGEFGLINRLRNLLGVSPAIKGIGDDAAILEIPGSEYLLATVDMLVDGVHFHLTDSNAQDVGARALAVNASDIAAMGGRPTFALVSLALPPHLAAVQVERMYVGMQKIASDLHVAVVGGNMTRTSGPVCIDVTLLGMVERDCVVRRDGARPGDALAVTGALGAAAALRAAENHDIKNSDSWREFAALHVVPSPRVAAGRALARARIPTAMMDISDGLAGDLRHMLDESHVGAEIHEADLPISGEARAMAERASDDASHLALYGGEDYELLLALPASRFREAQDLLAPLPLTRIGTVTSWEDGARIVGASGEQRPLRPGGWTHF